MERIIEMPHKLKPEFYTYDYLAELQNTIIDCSEEKIILDFHNCKFSHAIFTSFIGALSVWAESFNKNLIFRVARNSNV